jgi:hypothetical protein
MGSKAFIAFIEFIALKSRGVVASLRHWVVVNSSLGHCVIESKTSSSSAGLLGLKGHRVVASLRRRVKNAYAVGGWRIVCSLCFFCEIGVS